MVSVDCIFFTETPFATELQKPKKRRHEEDDDDDGSYGDGSFVNPKSVGFVAGERETHTEREMAHGGYGKRRVSGFPAGPRRTAGGRGLGVRQKDHSAEKKARIASIKNQIRSIERLLRKALPLEIKDAQKKRLEELKKEAEIHTQAELERKLTLRYRKLKFFERRKIERSIRRLEKLHRSAAEHPSDEVTRQAADVGQQLVWLKEDLEYVKFFPKTEKYISLFMGNGDENVVAKRNKLREQIKAKLRDAAAMGVEIEETGSEDDGAIDMSEDDFFLASNLSDDADADDEWTDKSPRVADDRDDTSKEAISSSSKDGLQSDKKSLDNPFLVPHDSTNSLHWNSIAKINQVQKEDTTSMPEPLYSKDASSGSGIRPRINMWPSSGNSSEMEMAGSQGTSNTGDESGRLENWQISSNSSDIAMDFTFHGDTENISLNSNTQLKARHRRLRSKKKHL